MKEFICPTCGTRYTMEELEDYEGVCTVCDELIPENEKEFDRESY